MTDYPAMLDTTRRIEPVPRRVRGYFGGRLLFDTIQAVYVWEWANYPQYYIPLADVDSSVLVDEDHPQKLSRGIARRHGLRLGDHAHPGAARVYGDDAVPGVAGTVCFEWDALPPGSKKTKKSSCTHAILTPASTRCARAGPSAPSSTGHCWPGQVPP
jgi:uncharacterized protein (DUF427 family)